MNENKAARYQRQVRRGRALAVAARASVLVGAIALDFPPRGLAPVLTQLLPAPLAAEPAAEALAAAVMAALAAACLVVAVETAALPFVWWVEFVLERRYGLSRERLGDWLRGHLLQASARRVVWWTVAAGAVFLLIAYRPDDWWWLAGAGFLLATVGRAMLAPRLLARWLFVTAPLQRPRLRRRLELLAARAGAPGIDIREWRIGARSDTANAAVVGVGPSRRILVSDTLLQDYSDPEIEVVVAHELAHHRHRDLWQSIALDAVVVTAGCLTVQVLLTGYFAGADLPRLGDPAGLPLMGFVVAVVQIGASPLTRGLSRWHERRADRFAIRMTGNRDAFVSGLRRLAAHHLADEHPSRLVEWLFYSHPPLGARMAAARPDRRVGSLAGRETSTP